MINATTQNSETTLRGSAVAQPVRRLGTGTFWALIGLELLLLFGTLVWSFGWLASVPTPYASKQALAPVQEAIWSRVGGATLDPLIEVAPGINARESNLRGFQLEGRTYYYYIVGESNFDPLSSGRVNEQQVEVLLRDESGAKPIVIYTIKASTN